MKSESRLTPKVRRELSESYSPLGLFHPCISCREKRELTCPVVETEKLHDKDCPGACARSTPVGVGAENYPATPSAPITIW